MTGGPSSLATGPTVPVADFPKVQGTGGVVAGPWVGCQMRKWQGRGRPGGGVCWRLGLCGPCPLCD